MDDDVGVVAVDVGGEAFPVDVGCTGGEIVAALALQEGLDASEYGLFFSTKNTATNTEESDWVFPHSTLASCGIGSYGIGSCGIGSCGMGSCGTGSDGTEIKVVLRKKRVILKVQLADMSVKSFVVDGSLPVGQLIVEIGSKLGMQSTDDVALLPLECEAPHRDALDRMRTLAGNRVSEGETLQLKQLFILRDPNVDVPSDVDTRFDQQLNDLLANTFLVTEEEAVTLAALLCQLRLGDYEVGEEGGFELCTLLPPEFVGNKLLSKAIARKHRTLAGMRPLVAQFRFVQQCRSRSLPGTGCMYFRVGVPCDAATENTKNETKTKTKKKKKKMVERWLGVGPDGITCHALTSKEQVMHVPLEDLRRWAVVDGGIVFDFGTQPFFAVSTTASDEIGSACTLLTHKPTVS